MIDVCLGGGDWFDLFLMENGEDTDQYCCHGFGRLLDVLNLLMKKHPDHEIYFYSN